MADQIESNRVQALPARPGRAAVAPRDGLFDTAENRRRLMLVSLALLMVPGTFSIAGTLLSPYRIFLLGIFPFLVRAWLAGGAGRPNTVDILVLLSTAWTMMALLVNHGTAMGPRAALLCLEFFGGYLLGRVLVRDRADFEAYVRSFMQVFLVLSPFILIEMVTGFNILKTLAGMVMNTGVADKPKRLGLFRAQGPLEHPILLGLVASLCFAPAYYMFGKLRGGFMFLMMFASLSSGPLLGAMIQLFLIAWDRVFGFLKGVKWMLLLYLAVLAGFGLALASQFDLLNFVIKNLMYDPRTASGRIVNMIWGTKEMLANPVFGVGVGGYARPWWLMHETSFDNFWLNYGMRYGIPSLVLLLGGIIFSMVRIATLTTLTEQENEYRKGYLFALTGVCLILGTVFIWSASSVFVMMYIGAGAWFYMQPRAPESDAEAATRARRAAQVRAFNVGPLVPAERRAAGQVASGRSSR